MNLKQTQGDDDSRMSECPLKTDKEDNDAKINECPFKVDKQDEDATITLKQTNVYIHFPTHSSICAMNPHMSFDQTMSAII